MGSSISSRPSSSSWQQHHSSWDPVSGENSAVGYVLCLQVC
jgi:hypothetical protein